MHELPDRARGLIGGSAPASGSALGRPGRARGRRAAAHLPGRAAAHLPGRAAAHLRRRPAHRPQDCRHRRPPDAGGAHRTLPASAFGEDERALRLRLATGLLYGDSDAQREAALAAADPVTLPRISAALTALSGMLAALGPPGRRTGQLATDSGGWPGG